MKVYDYEESNKVIAEAWKLAIKHLEDALGDQYECDITENAMDKFWDCVQQDIEFKKECPFCNKIDCEGNFSPSPFYPEVEICYDCYVEESLK